MTCRRLVHIEDFLVLKFMVVLSSVTKHHSYHIASALQQAGLLTRFFTSFYLKYPRLGRLHKKLLNRHDERLDANKITSLCGPELFFKSMRSIPCVNRIFGHSSWVTHGFDWYDRRVAQLLKKSNASGFHGFEGSCLHSLRAARKRGMITVLEFPIFNPKLWVDILKEEYSRFGIAFSDVLQNGRHLERKYLEIALADYVIVPTSRIRDTFVRDNVGSEKILVIPYGADLRRFHRQNNEKHSTFRILFVGSISLNKGVYYLLRAYKELGLPHSELVLIGKVDPSMERVLREFNGSYIHLGTVPNHILPNHYQNSSLFVLPSLSEGSAYVVYEAMACGLPVIVTENCGSIVRDGKDGFVVPIRDVESLKEKIAHLYENRGLCEQIGDSAADHVRNFTWEKYGQRVVQAYRKIIGCERVIPACTV